MYVVKRDGKKEPVMFDKITARVRKLCYGLNDLVDPIKISMRNKRSEYLLDFENIMLHYL